MLAKKFKVSVSGDVAKFGFAPKLSIDFRLEADDMDRDELLKFVDTTRLFVFSMKVGFAVLVSVEDAWQFVEVIRIFWTKKTLDNDFGIKIGACVVVVDPDSGRKFEVEALQPVAYLFVGDNPPIYNETFEESSVFVDSLIDSLKKALRVRIAEAVSGRQEKARVVKKFDSLVKSLG